jgi:hypothetical protein
MNAIPPITWSDVATHDDLALLRSDLRAEMAELRSDLRAEMAELRSDLRGEMAELRSDFTIEMVPPEARLQRSIITWILAAQGVTLATNTVLITVAMIVIA